MQLEQTSPDSTRTAVGKVILLAYPVVLATLASTLMGLVDMLFMGRVSTGAQGAVGLGGILTWTVASLFVGSLTVINTFVAQYFGEGRTRQCGIVTWQGILLGAGFSLVAVSLVGVVPRLVPLFGAPPEVAAIATTYAVIRIWGFPLEFVEVSITSFMRGIGDTMIPMKVSMATVLLNVPLNCWLIFGGAGVEPLGAAGAAYATVAARGLGLVVLLWLFSRRSMRLELGTGLPDLRALVSRRLLKILWVGLPIGVGWMLEMGTWLVFTAVISKLGEVPLAAHSIVIQVLHLSFMPGVAISVAATTLVGQHLGANQPALARQSSNAALLLGVSFMAVMGIIYLLLGDHIAGSFNPDPAVIRTAHRLFAIAAAFQIFDAMNMVSGGTLRGAGDTRFPMFAAVGFSWLVFLPLIWLLGIHLGWGAEGAWVGATCYIIGLGLLLFFRVRAGRWTTLRVT